jgi:hypothetical protein
MMVQCIDGIVENEMSFSASLAINYGSLLWNSTYYWTPKFEIYISGTYCSEIRTDMGNGFRHERIVMPMLIIPARSNAKCDDMICQFQKRSAPHIVLFIALFNLFQ